MGDSYPVVKVAAVQACSVFLNREASTEKACRLIREAGKNGAKVIVFPEGFIPAHPAWYHIHAATSSISTELGVELFKNSVEIPGAETVELGKAAKDANAWVVMGCCEKRPNTMGTLYNSFLFINPQGEVVFKHQKFMPTVGERLIHALGGPETMGLVQTDFGPLSGLLCGENANPLAIFSTIMGGPVIHAAAWPNFGNLNNKSMKASIQTRTQAFAQIGKCFVVSACSTVDEYMIEKLRINDETAVLLREPQRTGGSMIAAPSGGLIAGPMGNEEGILYADCDLELCLRYKLEQDFSGFYNRPDMFTLIQRKAPLRLYVEKYDDPYTAEYVSETNLENENDEKDGNPDSSPKLSSHFG